MTDFDPRQVEQEAHRLREEGKFAEAARLFRELVNRFPNWEDGGGAFDLASCLEDLGDFAGAAKAYEMALQHDPSNKIFIGNYNSVLGPVYKVIDA
jgi:Flp pilus assembly protein TadD